MKHFYSIIGIVAGILILTSTLLQPYCAKNDGQWQAQGSKKNTAIASTYCNPSGLLLSSTAQVSQECCCGASTNKCRPTQQENKVPLFITLEAELELEDSPFEESSFFDTLQRTFFSSLASSDKETLTHSKHTNTCPPHSFTKEYCTWLI